MAKICITGASGTVGSALVPYLRAQGHDVVAFQRNTPCSLEGFDVVINLAGSPIAEGRWNKVRKEKILNSRVKITRLLVEAMKVCRKPPTLLISASAIGFYSDNGDAMVAEDAPQGTGFLADVCGQWEHEARLAADIGVRVVLVRIGMVLTPAGGALRKMLPVFKMGFGARLGSGNQWMSWISIRDLVAAISHCIVTETISGPVNAVAPNPVQNTEFTKQLAKALKVPAWFIVPGWVLRLFLGKLADEAMLSSIKVSPNVLLNTDFTFQDAHLETALDNLF